MSGTLLDEWLEKAEENFRVAVRENRYTKEPAHDTVCFNAQQCAEKHLKAFLVRHRIAISKTHDLDDLRQRCEQIDSTFTLVADSLRELYRYAGDIRYPGARATKQDAREAVAAMKQVRQFVRQRLGLK